jgi:hypothetical protein
MAPARGFSPSASALDSAPSSNTALAASPKDPSSSAAGPKRKPPAKRPTGPSPHVVDNALRTTFEQPPLPDTGRVPHFSAAAAACRAKGQRSASPSQRVPGHSPEMRRPPTPSDLSSATNAAVSAPGSSGSLIASRPQIPGRTAIRISPNEGIRPGDGRPAKLLRPSWL